MRRTLFALLVVAAAVAACFAFSAPASSRQGQVATLTIVKVVDGDGPTGGYAIDYDCTPAGKGGGGSASDSAHFDTAGPGVDESQDVVLDGPSVCTVTETQSNGAASVSYACDFTPGQPPGSPDSNFAADPEGGGAHGCVDEQTGVILFPGDHLTITVTNTFEPDVLPDDEEPPPPAVEPDVVTATPTFTG